MSLEMAHKVILPPKKNYIPQFLKQRDINSYIVGGLFVGVTLLFDVKNRTSSNIFHPLLYIIETSQNVFKKWIAFHVLFLIRLKFGFIKLSFLRTDFKKVVASSFLRQVG